MQTYTVYIATDSNRTYLEVGYCTNLIHRSQAIQDDTTILFGNSPKLTNVVYTATFEELEQAKAYYNSLKKYTRMQREKLIRLKNPNWLNLSTPIRNKSNNYHTQKVVVYA